MAKIPVDMRNNQVNEEKEENENKQRLIQCESEIVDLNSKNTELAIKVNGLEKNLNWAHIELKKNATQIGKNFFFNFYYDSYYFRI